MPKRQYPDFHKTLVEQGAYPEAPRRIKMVETQDTYHYKTGAALYKIRKATGPYANLALKEVYTREAVALSRRWSPELRAELVPIVQREGGYQLGGEGTVADYALKQVQLQESYFLDRLLDQDKFNATGAGRLARYLAAHHSAQVAEGTVRDEARPEHMRDLAEEVFYQIKKYVGVTLSQALLDMASRPLLRFLDDERRLLLRRQKKGYTIATHGAFIPEHIYMKGSDVCTVGHLVGANKFRTLDAANDVACLNNALLLRGLEEHSAAFVKRYVSVSKDRDVIRVLPWYQVFQALRRGLLHSERQAVLSGQDAAWRDLGDRARRNFNLAVQIAREMGPT